MSVTRSNWKPHEVRDARLSIALVSQEYPPETARGGIGTQTHAKAIGLAGRGHRVHVVSRSVDEVPRTYRDEGVEVRRVIASLDGVEATSPAADWLAYSTAVAAELARLREEEPLDLIEFPEWGNEGYVHLLNRPDWDPVPVVVHIHGPLVLYAHTIGWPAVGSQEYEAGLAMEAVCLRLADAVMSSSACSAEWCAQSYDLDTASIPVLHSGVDTEAFAPTGGARDERPTVVFTGRITANKGADVLVRAACEVAHTIPELRLRMLGRGEPEFLDRLRAIASSAGHPQLLEFPGFVERGRLPAELSAAHVFALPSLYEPGPGLAYLEAMACELPAIGCSNAGAVEVIMPGENGLLVPPSDADALAEALLALLQDEAGRAELGRRARAFVQATAETNDCVERIEAFYRDVVRSGRRSTSTASRYDKRSGQRTRAAVARRAAGY